jgi:hypothetical protein
MTSEQDQPGKPWYISSDEGDEQQEDESMEGKDNPSHEEKAVAKVQHGKCLASSLGQEIYRHPRGSQM